MVGQPVERRAERRIVAQPGRPFAQPPVERGFDRCDVRAELGLKAGRVADEIPGVDLKNFASSCRESCERCGRVPRSMSDR